jgi:DNA-binding SARP family transcriptional activator
MTNFATPANLSVARELRGIAGARLHRASGPTKARAIGGRPPHRLMDMRLGRPCYNRCVEFRLLGPLEVTAGEPVAIHGRKQRALLTVLLLHVNKVVSTDRLVNDLWGEKPPPTATASLQNAVSALRKLLGDDVLLTRPPGYVVAVDPAQLDLTRFERLVAEARALPAENRAAVLRDALALWRGPALAEFEYEAFAQDEIRRLEELRLTTVGDRIDADLELGRHAEVVGELETLIGQNPVRERLRGQLMLALYRSGRQAEALDAYRDARRTLTEELGIEPTPSLQHLHASILRQEAGLDLGGATARVSFSDEAQEAVRALLDGRLVLVLGAGVNREDNGDPYLRPDDVAAYLADRFGCPPEERRDLARVAQFVAVTKGTGPLYDELHELLAADHARGPLHRRLAELPRSLRERGAPQPIVATTNYDHALERALADAGEPFDTLSYVATGRDRGKFIHATADGPTTLIDLPNTYADLPVGNRLIVVKVHGQVDPDPGREHESFVVSEDDYIGYLAQTEITSVLPVTLAAKLRRSHFLFLGYPLRDWTLRVFLQRIWLDERPSYRSWAIQPGSEPVEREYWRYRGVDVVESELGDYVERMATLLREAPGRGVAA